MLSIEDYISMYRLGMYVPENVIVYISTAPGKKVTRRKISNFESSLLQEEYIFPVSSRSSKIRKERSEELSKCSGCPRGTEEEKVGLVIENSGFRVKVSSTSRFCYNLGRSVVKLEIIHPSLPDHRINNIYLGSGTFLKYVSMYGVDRDGYINSEFAIACRGGGVHEFTIVPMTGEMETIKMCTKVWETGRNTSKWIPGHAYLLKNRKVVIYLGEWNNRVYYSHGPKGSIFRIEFNKVKWYDLPEYEFSGRSFRDRSKHVLITHTTECLEYIKNTAPGEVLKNKAYREWNHPGFKDVDTRTKMILDQIGNILCPPDCLGIDLGEAIDVRYLNIEKELISAAGNFIDIGKDTKLFPVSILPDYDKLPEELKDILLTCLAGSLPWGEVELNKKSQDDIIRQYCPGLCEAYRISQPKRLEDKCRKACEELLKKNRK